MPSPEHCPEGCDGGRSERLGCGFTGSQRRGRRSRATGPPRHIRTTTDLHRKTTATFTNRAERGRAGGEAGRRPHAEHRPARGRSALLPHPGPSGFPSGAARSAGACSGAGCCARPSAGPKGRAPIQASAYAAVAEPVKKWGGPSEAVSGAAGRRRRHPLEVKSQAHTAQGVHGATLRATASRFSASPYVPITPPPYHHPDQPLFWTWALCSKV